MPVGAETYGAYGPQGIKLIKQIGKKNARSYRVACHLLDGHFQEHFFFLSTFQLLQTMWAIYRLPLRFFWDFFLFTKTCNFEPSCYVIKIVLLLSVKDT